MAAWMLSMSVQEKVARVLACRSAPGPSGPALVPYFTGYPGGLPAPLSGSLGGADSSGPGTSGPWYIPGVTKVGAACKGPDQPPKTGYQP